MQNPYYRQELTNSIREMVKSQLPRGLETTYDILLDFMSNSDDECLKDTAAFIKVSRKSDEIGRMFIFSMSLLQPDVEPIREDIYVKGIDGLKDLDDHFVEKYGKGENVKINAKIINFFKWLFLRLPAKDELKRFGLIY